MIHPIFHFLVVVTLALVVGCGPKAAGHSKGDGHGHEEKADGGEGRHEHGAEESGASFREGEGIQLTNEARKALEVTVAEVTSQKLNPSVKVTAQVYRTARESGGSSERSGFSYASAFVDEHVAKQLKKGGETTAYLSSPASASIRGILKSVDTSLVVSTGKAEILAEFPDPENLLKMGEFVTVDLPESTTLRDVIAVPISSVLDTASGKFAYVQNGDALLRTPITTGPAGGELIEVTDGLYEGDTIAVTGAEALYLIELRATKGGGHSH